MSHLAITDITGREWVGNSQRFSVRDQERMDILFSKGIRNLSNLAIAIGGNYHYFNTDNLISVTVVTDDKDEEDAS